MKPQATLCRRDKITGRKLDRIECFFYKNGVLFHRHSLVEDTEKNRELFPVHRKFWNKLYTTQEFMLLPDEAEELLSMFTRKDFAPYVRRFFRSSKLTRLLWRITLKLSVIWHKRQLQ